VELPAAPHYNAARGIRAASVPLGEYWQSLTRLQTEGILGTRALSLQRQTSSPVAPSGLKPGAGDPELGTTTNRGLHEFLLDRVLPRYTRPGARAADLGAGTGALGVRLRELGCEVVAVDLRPGQFRADLPFLQMNLDDADFASSLGAGAFALVTSVEVIAHVESPIGFLRNVRRLLSPGGVAVLTTPNVDNAPARIKFLLKGKIRMMDEIGEPTHVSPIFWDLFNRQYLPRAGLRLVEHHLFPPRDFQLTRRRFAWLMRALARGLRGPALFGDNHVFVLAPE